MPHNPIREARMNDSPNYTEYAVAQKAEGKYLIGRILLIILYVVFAIGWIAVLVGILHLWPLGAIMPIFLWMLVHFTWRYVAVEHEYVISSGTMTFSDIYNRRARKTLFEVKIRDMTKIAPMTEEYAAQYADAAETADYRGSVGSPDSYFFTYSDESGKKRAVFFEATNKAIKIMRFYNASATVMSTTLRY